MTKRSVLAAILLSFVLTATSAAQATEFTYQGQLQSSSAAANGNFDFEFMLFDAAFGGSQLGLTLTRSGVAIANNAAARRKRGEDKAQGRNKRIENCSVLDGFPGADM